MKKKNIAILLLIPFVIALFGIVSDNITVKLFAGDISYIEWDYADVEAYKYAENVRYPLQARGVAPSNAPLAEGNDLVWEVVNADGTEEPYARIEQVGDKFYLVPLKVGEVRLTCANENDTVQRSTTVIIYESSVVYFYTKIQSSQNNIDDKLYYGEYDLDQNGVAVPAEIDVEIVCYPTELAKTISVDASDNLSVDVNTGTIKIGSIDKNEHATFTLTAGIEEEGTLTTFSRSFEIVDEGVNVYTYDDLLACTNRSANGEIVVLRKSFEALNRAYKTGKENEPLLENGVPVKVADNVECFGHFDLSTKRYSFAEEVYSFETTYNHAYIDQWNEFARGNKNYREISAIINVGLRVQKDFYGNGYTINLHNLTFPYTTETLSDVNGNVTAVIPKLRSDNLFRGPLSFYTLGDPYNEPMVTAYGQDHIGMYVDGDNVTINDVYLKNCDVGSSFSNLKYVGTVMEISGDNVTVQNSVLQNGKHVLRAISSQNTLIDNCMLQNALNFLMVVGSDKYIPIDGSQSFTFENKDGKTVTATLDQFLAAQEGVEGNELLNTYLADYYDPATMRSALQTLQDALDSAAAGLEYDGTVNVNDTLFYRSGIASIGMESYFNGPFLYSKAPSIISELFSATVDGYVSRPLVPMIPQKVSGVSYPVHLNLSGTTRFYDYKTQDDMDLSWLIDENISSIAREIYKAMGKDKDVTITIDDIFPIKSMLYRDAARDLYSDNDKCYLNVVVAFYGGSTNRSVVTYEGLACADEMDQTIDVNWVDAYLPNQFSLSNIRELFEDPTKVQGLMQKTVTVVTGVEPFRFVCMKGNGYLFGETPQVSELKENSRG